jgi:hypothetical protein
MITADEIHTAAVAYMLEDVECVSVSQVASRVACSTPIEYPDGDHVVTWITPEDGGALVTDYGKGFERILSHPPQARATLQQLGRSFAEAQGVDYYDGRVSARVNAEDIGEAIWRVAAASAQLAQAATVFHPKRRSRDSDFAGAVAGIFQARQVEFDSRVPIEGASGRIHHATFYVPTRPTVIEPVAPTGIWSQVSSVYAKFGDLAHKKNGAPPRLYSLVDDRERTLSEQDTGFLQQVSEVVPWSENERLLEQVT